MLTLFIYECSSRLTILSFCFSNLSKAFLIFLNLIQKGYVDIFISWRIFIQVTSFCGTNYLISNLRTQATAIGLSKKFIFLSTSTLVYQIIYLLQNNTLPSRSLISLSLLLLPDYHRHLSEQQLTYQQRVSLTATK